MAVLEFHVRRVEAGITLLDFMTSHLGGSRRQAKAILDRRAVFVNRQRIWMARHCLHAGDVVELDAASVSAPALRADLVLYEDADYLVLNKPSGMTADGAQSAETALRALRNEPALAAAHRLDRDTSGCLLFARNTRAAEMIIPLFRRRQVRKVYHAIVAGHVAQGERIIARAIDGRPARSIIRTLDANRQASHLIVVIETGRKHQIRKHLAGIGHPLIGDVQYAARRELAALERRAPRQMLHAWQLSFCHPVSGLPVQSTARLPFDFMACLKHLRLK